MSKAAVLNPQTPSEGEELSFPAGANRDHYHRHLVFDHAVTPDNASQRERFEAVAHSLRDLLTERWLLTQATHDRENPKRVYYLSMEFLIGRTLVNNIINLGAEGFVRDNLRSDPRQDWKEVIEAEPDAGLGNGGLGRLAACFVDSLATLQIPAIGYGLRFHYGIFRQTFENGHQVEQPDHWLAQPDPWEVARPRETVQAPLECSFRLENGAFRAVPGHPTHLLGVPHDRPVVGYGGRTINTLRLWDAASPDFFNFGEFSSGDFVGAIVHRVLAETVTRVLYPDDSTTAGQALRFFQEYFLVCCSLADIVQRFRRANDDWRLIPDKVAIQLNDTHPAMAVAELMRILLDQAKLGWDEAWDLTVRTLAYTNHTLLPEALEKWPVRLFELVCPRLLEIIYEVNRRFLGAIHERYNGDEGRLGRMSLIEESPVRQVRMANLAIVGTHSTNGVAQIHSDLVRTRLVTDFAEMFPERFNNKTNGVTPRRWLLLANPGLSRLITEAIGDDWVTDLSELSRLAPFVDDAAFRDNFRQAKRTAKENFAAWLMCATGQKIDPNTIFDSQIKRIHEYKRQLLNVLHIVVLYNRVRNDPAQAGAPRTFFFAGKAAPAYRLAKLIIKLVNNVGRAIDDDPAARERLKVVFLPNYNVTMAERLIPASDVSEQISTAGYEASGTGNMKFMLNGALTIGTRDGATIEMAEEAGEENFFLFGLTAEQVQNSRSWYDPHWHYEHEPETRQALDLIFNDHFSRDEPGVFEPIRETLLSKGDYYMHLADLASYAQAHERLGALYAQSDAWTRKAIVNVACSGKFSSDRTIAEYAAGIWNGSRARWTKGVINFERALAARGQGLRPAASTAFESVENAMSKKQMSEAPPRMKRKEYEKELRGLQTQLCLLQQWVVHAGLRVIVVFEGRDAAGKGGTIKAMMERVSPRVFRLVALPAPSDREKTQLFVQRYMQHFPAAGEVVIFDRSWYNRAGVEYVMGFCTKDQYQKFVENCPKFENHIIQSGIILIKFWLEVGQKEQQRRFEARIEDPLRWWKLSPMDVESYSRWYDYSRARDMMLEATDTAESPWNIVRSDDKRRARLNCITHLLSALPCEEVAREKIKLPKRSNKGEYDDQLTLKGRNFVPERY